MEPEQGQSNWENVKKWLGIVPPPGLKDKTPQSVFGYRLRDPYQGEAAFFNNNPFVSGMAADDGMIVLNPNAQLSDRERHAVAQNEASRLWMRQNNISPDFVVTPEQLNSFKGTPYANSENERDLKHTILARMISGDPSAGNTTGHQQFWAEWLRQMLRNRQ